MTTHSKKILFVIFSLVFVSVIVIAFGFFAYPPPSGPSILFIPAAINFASGNGLVNEISHWAQWIDTTGNYRFLTYMPLFPIFLAALILFSPTSYGVFIAVAFLEVVVLALSGLLLFKAATAGGKSLDWFKAILISLSFAVLVVPFQILSTRSDILFQIILLLSALAIFYFFESRFLWLILAVLLGISAATHPMYVVVLVALLGAFIAARYPTRSAVVELCKICGTGFVVFLIILAVTPFGVVEKIEAVMRHSTAYGEGSWFGAGYAGDFVTRFFTNPVSFFSGALLLLFIVLGVRMYLTHRRAIQSPALFVLFFALFALTLLSVVARPAHIYFFEMLLPLVLPLIIYAVDETRVRSFLKPAAMLVFLVVSVSFVRQAALFPIFLKDGVSLREARAVYEQLKPDVCVDRCVGLASGGLWPLSEDYKTILTSNQAQNMGLRLGDLVDVIFFEQNYSGMTTPPEAIDGCVLEKNLFIEEQPKLFGVKLGNTMPGYAFAAYRCMRDR